QRDRVLEDAPGDRIGAAERGRARRVLEVDLPAEIGLDPLHARSRRLRRLCRVKDNAKLRRAHRSSAPMTTNRDLMNAAAPSLEHLVKLAPKLVPGGARIAGVGPLSGGASQDLWSVLVETEAGEQTPVVLRRSPEGRPRSALAIPNALEAELIAAAYAAGAPSPRVLHVLGPEYGLGEGFFMERVDGEALGQRIVRDTAFA